MITMSWRGVGWRPGASTIRETLCGPADVSVCADLPALLAALGRAGPQAEGFRGGTRAVDALYAAPATVPTTRIANVSGSSVEDRDRPAQVFAGFAADRFRSALTNVRKAVGIPTFSLDD